MQDTTRRAGGAGFGSPSGLLPLLLVCGMAMAQVNEELPDFDRLWVFHRPAETRAKFEELLPRAEAAGDVSYLLQLRTQIARTYGLEGRFDEAHQVLDRVERELSADLAPARVRYLLERGRTLNSSKRPAEARPLFVEALEIAREGGFDRHAVDAAHMLAIVAADAADGHAWNQRAIALAEESEDPRARGWLGPLYHNTGMTHLDAGEYEAALAIFEKAWLFRQQRDDPRATHIAKWMVAHTFRRMGRLDIALAMQREMEQQRSRAAESGAGTEDPATDGFVAEEIAEILLAKERSDEARPYFRTAYEKLRDVAWVRTDKDGERLARMRRLAGTETEPGEDTR